MVGVGIACADTQKTADLPFFFGFDFNTPAFERLIRREFTSDELPSLLEETFAYKDVDDTIRRLPRDAAQTLVDVMDEARCPSTRYREPMQRDRY